MRHIGFKIASEEIRSIVLDNREAYEGIYIIGFSIGATIAWLCNEEDNLNGIIGYYGSRIRDYLEISPKCPTMLFFRKQEQLYDVVDLLSSLEEENISAYQFKGQHGFSHPSTLQNIMKN